MPIKILIHTITRDHVKSYKSLSPYSKTGYVKLIFSFGPSSRQILICSSLHFDSPGIEKFFGVQ